MLFGGCCSKKGSSSSAFSSVRSTWPLCREMTVFVERLAEMALRPFVEQCVRRPAVEAAHAAGRVQNRDIADAAKIADHARFVFRAEHGGVKGRHERRALAAGGDVAAAEIGDHVDVRHFREQRGIVDLPRVAFFRPMPHRLAVHADRADFRGRARGSCAAIRGSTPCSAWRAHWPPAPRVRFRCRPAAEARTARRAGLPRSRQTPRPSTTGGLPLANWTATPSTPSMLVPDINPK